MDLEIAMAPARQQMQCNLIGPDGVATPPPPPTFDVDAQAYFDRVATTVAFSDTFKAACNSFVLALKSDGLWSKLIAFYPFNVEIAGQEVFNLASSSFTAAKSGTLTLDPLKGITGNGTSGFYDTGFTLDDTSKLNLSLGFVYLSGNSGNSEFGTAAGGSNDVTWLLNAAGSIFFRLGGSINVTGSTGGGVKHVVGVRNGASDFVFNDAAQLGTTAVTDVSVTASNLLLLKKAATFCNNKHGCMYVASAFDQSAATAMYNDVKAFMNSLSPGLVP